MVTIIFVLFFYIRSLLDYSEKRNKKDKNKNQKVYFVSKMLKNLEQLWMVHHLFWIF